tara:strand:- start:489 stop:1439 length:951 start_codon:yes stop_codon:yes gene_type:complete
MATWKKVITTADDADYLNSNVSVNTYTGTGVISVNAGTNVISSSAQANVSGNSGNAALYDDSGTPTLKTGITAAEVRLAIGAGTSSLALGTSGSTALAGNTSLLQIGTSGTTAMAGNTAVGDANVSGDNGNSAIYDNSGTPTLKSGITQAEMLLAIGAQASGSYAPAAGNSNQSFATDDLAVSGNLTVTGTIDTVNETNSTLVDKTITLSSGSSTEAASDGSGIIINTGQTLEPALTWYDDTVANNTDGRLGIGWLMKSTTEAQSATTNYHVMGFKADAGQPGVAVKASGEGAFYWDSTNDALYVCTNAYTNTGGG